MNVQIKVEINVQRINHKNVKQVKPNIQKRIIFYEFCYE